jgi:hypothetical protein
MNAAIDSPDLNQLSGRHLAPPVKSVVTSGAKPSSENSKHDERCRKHLKSPFQQIVSGF